MEVLLWIISPFAWIVLSFVTMEVVHGKGYSYGLGILVGLFLGPIGLIAGLLMPINQEGREQQRIRAAAAEVERKQRLANYQTEYQAKLAAKAARTAEPPTPEDSNDRLTTIGAIVLIACPLLVVIFQNTTAQLVFGAGALVGFGVYVIGVFRVKKTEAETF